MQIALYMNNANSSVHEHLLSITSGPVAEEMLF